MSTDLMKELHVLHDAETPLSSMVQIINRKFKTTHTRMSIAILLKKLSKKAQTPSSKNTAGLRLVAVGAYNHCQWPGDNGRKCRSLIGDARIKGVENYCVEHQIRALRPDVRARAERMLKRRSP
jgi:hypothetical protein